MNNIRIHKLDSITEVEIDGNVIRGVADYKVTSSADGTTKLVLKLVFKSNVTEFEMSATQEEQTSLDL